MATLVNKMNRGVKVIIPNIREFRTFYSDNEGVIGMFFKRDWKEQTEEREEHWKPSKEQMEALDRCVEYLDESDNEDAEVMSSLSADLQKLL